MTQLKFNQITTKNLTAITDCQRPSMLK